MHAKQREKPTVSRAERDDSLFRLVGSFFGVNLLLAGVFVVLVPHLIVSRLGRKIRRWSPTRRRRPARFVRPVSPSYSRR